jgi:hypothetical protein
MRGELQSVLVLKFVYLPKAGCNNGFVIYPERQWTAPDKGDAPLFLQAVFVDLV